MFGLLDLLSHVLTVPSFGAELAALVGLRVGIDYALFIVTRYRQGLSEGLAPAEAVSKALATSGRAVVFAGSTVVLSLLGLFLLGLPFIYGAALGAVLAVLLVMAASITLLPAALGFAGPNIDGLRVSLRRRRQAAMGPSFSARWSRQVQRRPWAAGGAALMVLVVLARPFVSLHLAFTDSGTNPTTYTSRHAYDLLAEGFGPGAAGPLVIATSLPGGSGAASGDAAVVDRLARHVSALPDVPVRKHREQGHTDGHGYGHVQHKGRRGAQPYLLRVSFGRHDQVGEHRFVGHFAQKDQREAEKRSERPGRPLGSVPFRRAEAQANRPAIFMAQTEGSPTR